MSLNLGASASQALAVNKELARQAGYIEAGRILNNKIEQLIAPKLPLMVRAYAATPVGRLALANLVLVGVQKVRPDDVRLQKLAYAGITEAYGTVFKDFNIEGLIDSFLSDSAIAGALNTVGQE